LSIMPIMFAIYFLQMMDKQTITFASVFGISRETGLVGDDYSLVGSALYIAQIFCQPISAYFLVRFRLSIYVPVIVTCWGITLACMAAARSFSGLLISRLFLGAFEASIQGAFILTAQTWYRRREQGIRLAIWYSNAGLVNIFGPFIMYGIGHVRSPTLYAYQFIFLLLGAVTVIVGILAFFYFPENPVQCKFLTTDDKILAVERIRANQQGLTVNVFKIKQVYEMLFDIKSWCWMGIALLINIPSGGIAAFGPLIIKGFGFNGDIVMLLLTPYGALQILLLFLGFWTNQKLNKKWPIVVFISILPSLHQLNLLSVVILLCTGRTKEDQPILLFAYYLHSSGIVCAPTVINWQSSNVAGQTKKTATTAFMLVGYTSGNVIGPLLFNAQDKPYYHKGIMVMIICYSFALLLVAWTVLYLKYSNERHRKHRITRGRGGKIVDYSMIGATAVEAEHANSDSPADTGRHAFDDLTDLQNDEFIVSMPHISASLLNPIVYVY
ncbi:hypothetical protein HYPSUDRAFT_135365, partial [Hypholoma sublateritium FD-334 SS-4]